MELSEFFGASQSFNINLASEAHPLNLGPVDELQIGGLNSTKGGDIQVGSGWI